MTNLKRFFPIAATLVVSALVLSSCAGEKSPAPSVPAAEGAGAVIDVSSSPAAEETSPTAEAAAQPVADDAATTAAAPQI